MTGSGGFEIPRDAEVLVRDSEAQRIGEFVSFLPEVERIAQIVPDTEFSDPNPIRDAERRFIAFEYDNQPTLYLNPDVLDCPEQMIDLSFSPLVARGGKRSAHGVFFGELAIGEQSLRVAVKPHAANAFTTGLDDYFKTHGMDALGFNSLTPVGLLLGKDQDETAYSFTLLEEGLTTIDSIDWSEFYPFANEHPGMQEMWRSISDQAAILHARGNKSHGDMAARNIATNNEGITFLIDWEHARIDNNEARDAESRYSHSYSDISVLLESMCLPPHANIGGKTGIGIFYDKKADWWDGFCEVFFDEYVEMRRALAVQGTHHTRVMLEVEEELVQLRRTLCEDVAMFEEICAAIPPLGVDHRSNA